jgi:hypothetical protein
MHRSAEKRRRWRLWKENAKYGGNRTQGRKWKNYYKAFLDTHFSLSRGKNNFQLNKKIGTRGFCHLCGSEGEIVEKFPRRGYGKFGAGF